MTLSANTLDAIKALIANDEALLKRLSQASTPQAAAHTLAESGGMKRLNFSEYMAMSIFSVGLACAAYSMEHSSGPWDTRCRYNPD
ncbi:hypothetical protein IMZ29_19215 [Achromobacter sp. GG226]|uniref:hypothetical protein n=1 Tax=Verticiella alkaliphila TaxID=2779529 RepID=UPI001C0BFC99|nr:hypothetical protein [Verticiella sp. GG226]MBU4612595.1 hypothetical protein [Verticiella sp. GG226]